MNYNVMHAPKAFNTLEIASMALANNTDFSYPITLSDNLCWPKQLLTCIEVTNRLNSTLLQLKLESDEKLSACCTELYNPLSGPYQTITGAQLIYFGQIIPALLLLLRSLVWWVASYRISPSTSRPLLTFKFWAFLLSESLLSLAYSSTYQTIFMEFIKASVGN
jgi:hypothetical protein